MPNKLDPLNADVAQVQHDEGGFGTGRLIADNLVLTCAHVLWRSQEERDLGTIPPRQGWQVRLERDNGESGWCFRRGNRVVWHCKTLDLALIQLVEPPEGTVRPRLRLYVADITGNDPPQAEARGYPGASWETGKAQKETKLTPALGRLRAGDEKEPIIFGIDTCDLPNDPKDPDYGWPGMSGSAVTFLEPPDPEAIWVYGVVKHVPSHFDGQLRVARLAAAWRDAEFKDLLVSCGVADQPPEDPTRIIGDPGSSPTLLEPLQSDGGSGAARYGYRARAAALVGRDQELGLFQAFLGRPETFLWCGIEGPGGVGKSRFVLEALLKATDWHAGFLLPLPAHFDWTRWTPKRPTVIAIDDARARREELEVLIPHLAARRASDALWRKVRVVLIDRDLAFDKWFLGREVMRRAFETTQHQPGIPLGPLDPGAIRSIIRQMAPEANDDALRRADEWIATQKEEGNPLLAMLAPEVSAAGDESVASTRTFEDVVVDRLAAWGILPRQPDPTAAPSLEEDDRLALAFATVCAFPIVGLKFSDLPKIVPLQDRGKMRARLSHALGQPIKDTIPVLTPDLFGELFVLELLRYRREMGLDSDGAFMAAAWAQSASGATTFCRRCWTDFSDHPETPRLLGRPPGGSRTDLMSWMYAATTRYRECRAQGRSKEAQEIIARVRDAYMRDRRSSAFGIVVDLHTDTIDGDPMYDRTEAVRGLVVLLGLALPTDLADIPGECPKLRTLDEAWADLLDDGPKAFDNRWIGVLSVKAKWLVDACFEAVDEPALAQLEDAFQRAFLDMTRGLDKAAYERSPVLRKACDAFLQLAEMIPFKRKQLALDASFHIVMLFFLREPETAMTVEDERKLMGWLNVLASHLWLLFDDPPATDERAVLERLPVARLARQRFSDAFAGEVDARIADIIVGLLDHDRMEQAKALFAAWRDAPTRIGGDGNDHARRVRLIQERSSPEGTTERSSPHAQPD